MIFYNKSILIFFLCLFFSSYSYLYASNNVIFLEEVQSKRESSYKGLEINLYLLSDLYNYNNLFSFQISPFYKSSNILNNFDIRINYMDYNNDDFSSNSNYELALVYNIINFELLTLYINYGIYSMYNIKFYDFDLDKEINTRKYGNSFSIGMDTMIYRNIHLSFEKRWVKVEKDYIKNSNNFYLGFKLKIPLGLLKEV